MHDHTRTASHTPHLLGNDPPNESPIGAGGIAQSNAVKCVGRALSIGNRFVFPHLEALIARSPDAPLRHPPLFVLGPPRVGSTLMVQVIIDMLDLGYICNRHCQFYGAPALAEFLFRPRSRRPNSDHQSCYGATNGWHAPAECGEWWYRFFRREPSYITLGDVDVSKMRQFRQSVAAFTGACDRPILFKNLYASLRIQAIAHYLPESLFIVIHRNEVDNGHSLLEARHKQFNSYERWFSMEPPGSHALFARPAHEQVIGQVRCTHATIERDLRIAGVESSRRIDLTYEHFCRDPMENVRMLQAFLASNGCVVKQRGIDPPILKQRNAIRIDQALYAALVSHSESSRGPTDRPSQDERQT